MKLRIENVHIHLSSPKPPAGLIAALDIAGASRGAPLSEKASSSNAPGIGEKWPGLPATYAGISLSKDASHLVHLIVWDEAPEEGMTYADAVEAAEKINPTMESHLPTRHQGIHLYERLQHLFNQDYWHWLLDKNKSEKTAFLQSFDDGVQVINTLSCEGRVRAVSEIPL